MSELPTGQDGSVGDGESPAALRGPRPPALFVIAAVLLLQAAFLGFVLVWLILQELTVQESVEGGGLVIIVLVALALFWMLASAVGLLRMAPWSRGSILAIELLHAAIAFGLFQGIYAEPGYGWLLLTPAIVAVLLLFTPPVIQATMRRYADDPSAMRGE